MIESDVIYLIGFIIAFSFVLFGIDDLLWDIFSLFRGIGKKRVPLEEINEKPPKMLAIIIAAWHEDAVLGDVVDNMIRSSQYPSSMYRVFLGVYPNDEATLSVAHALAKRHGATVVPLVGKKPGPTSKADNINGTLRSIREYEKTHDVRFACVTIHDAEDVVHPNEFKMTNYLIDDYDALQFPVFPLQRMPRLRLFFKTLTSATYADEFAEHHFRTMVMRDELAFVPSAGTGFVLGRNVLESFGDKDVLPENSLTEDYRLSLTLRMQGFRVHYVLEKVPRINTEGRSVWDYIATRSLFPSTFRAAVRQKARWVYGITMQSAGLRDVVRKSALTFPERAFLYKDLKAKFANFVLLPGYAVFIYFVLQTFVHDLNLPVMYPLGSVSWWLCILLFFMMIERQVMRGRALLQIYGWRTMALSVLMPPLFPLRLLWGNLINLCATFKAWQQRITFKHQGENKRQKVEESRSEQPKTNKQPTWNKTDHEFLPESVLKRYRRLLGDTLLERGVIVSGHLEDALSSTRVQGTLLGETLLERGLIEEKHLTQAYALQQQSMFVETFPELVDTALLQQMPLNLEKRFGWLPLVRSSKGWIITIDDDVSPEERSEAQRLLGEEVFFLFSNTSNLLDTFLSIEPDAVPVHYPQLIATQHLLDTSNITLSQASLALAYALHLNRSLEDIVQEMGIAASYKHDGHSVSQETL